MADKSFGVKELNLLNASGTPTVTSPNNLNLNANTVAISTSCTIGNNLTVTSTTNSANLNVTGIGTLTRGFATDLSVSGISTISQPSNANPHSLWDVVNNGSSAYRFTGPGQDGAEDNPNIYLVRGQRYIFKVNASGHPFQLRVANGGAAYSDGVTNNGAQSGNVVINVQHDAPAQLYYQCTNHGSMVGNIYIVGGPQVISGVVTATTFVGNLTGNVTGTLQTAAQTNITSVGTLSALTVSGNINVSSTDPTIVFVDSDNNPDFDIKAGGGRFAIRDSTNNAERLRIDSSGRVLIGVNASYANASIDELQIGNNNSSNQSGLTIGSTDECAIAFADAGDARAGSITYNHGADAMIFKTSGQNERLRINSDGKINIGTLYNASTTHLDIRFDDTTTYSASSNHVNGLKIFNDCTTDNGFAGIELAATDGDDYYGSTLLKSIADGTNYSNDFVIQTRHSGTYAERLRIDSTGAVTTPNQPCFDVSKGNGTTSATNPIVYNTVHVNIGSHYSTSNGRFTAPVTGRYLFYFGAIKNNSSSVARLRLRRDGTTYMNSNRELRIDSNAGNYGENGSMTMIVSLNANQYVQVVCTEGNIYSGDEYNHFGGYLLS